MFSKNYSKDKEINDPSKYSLSKDVTWASPKGFDLTMDIYTPKKNQKTYPVLAIFHGGGFLVRRKEIMNNMAQYIASNHNYVVCNINYRLLGDQNNTVAFNEIINDAFGSILWIKENINKTEKSHFNKKLDILQADVLQSESDRLSLLDLV